MYTSWSQLFSRRVHMYIYKGEEIHKDVNKMKYIIWELVKTLIVTLSQFYKINFIYFRDEKPVVVRDEKILPMACGLGMYFSIWWCQCHHWSNQTQRENQGWISWFGSLLNSEYHTASYVHRLGGARITL